MKQGLRSRITIPASIRYLFLNHNAEAKTTTVMVIEISRFTTISIIMISIRLVISSNFRCWAKKTSS